MGSKFQGDEQEGWKRLYVDLQPEPEDEGPSIDELLDQLSRIISDIYLKQLATKNLQNEEPDQIVE